MGTEKRKRKWATIITPFLCAGTVLFLFRTVFLIGYVPTSSMEPMIPRNSYILGLRMYGTLETGDVILFQNAQEIVLVKRIAASKGELTPSGEVVPAGCFYVLGDNSENSFDSRYWTDPYVREEDVVAKCIWP